MAKKGKKGKKGKGKKAPVDPQVALDEETKQKYIDEFKELRKLEQRELADRNFYQLERDKINAVWQLDKQSVDVLSAEARNKDRELQEAQERHAVEARQYQQRIKHLLFEQQHTETGMRLDEELQATLQHTDHRAREAEVAKDERALKVQLKEMERSHMDVVKNMKLEHDRSVARERAEYERAGRELLARYEKRMRELRESLDSRKKVMVADLEARKTAHIEMLKKQHQRALHDINNYFKDIINSNMEKIKALMEEVDEWRKRENSNDKQMYDLVRENKHLHEPLTAATKEAESLRKKLHEYERDKIELASVKDGLVRSEDRQRRLDWRHEVLQQRFESLSKERDELKTGLVTSVYDVQQQVGLVNLVLEKKVEVMTEEVEKKETQLGEALLAAQLRRPDMEAVARKLDEVMQAKDRQLVEYESELQRVARAHADLIRMYHAKLAECGVPVENLGFIPKVMVSAGSEQYS